MILIIQNDEFQKKAIPLNVLEPKWSAFQSGTPISEAPKATKYSIYFRIL